uniref:Heparan-alpha-glucosaminide N-acetyltransferase catalytic domain-containing protein n=1 Tax=Megaviridae environmental sample TaxID=1737588 RepID=A0A5J6VHW7_9VIRU|nr:MAG: protein of unknown function DUF1624 [Megaviridae environmental sample]
MNVPQVQKPIKSHRIKEIDILRGMAIVAMCIFHIYLIREKTFGGKYIDQPWLVKLGVFARYTFIFLLGVSLTISRQTSRNYCKAQLKRITLIVVAAIYMTIGSYLFAKNPIQWGIMHFMAAAVIILGAFADTYLMPLFTIVILMWINHTSALNNILSKSPKLVAHAIGTPMYNTMDYFPILKWLPLVAFGIIVGKLLYVNGKRVYQEPNIDNVIAECFSWLGQHSLEFYIVHWMVIIGIFYMIRMCV